MLFTSFFGNAGKHPNAIAICQGTRGYPGIKTYKALAPTWKLLQASRNKELGEGEFIAQFRDQLAKLDPAQCEADLMAMVPAGETPILLCWEGPGQYCHRHTVAEWFRAAGVKIEEMPVTAKPKTPRLFK